MRGMDAVAKSGPDLESLPPGLASRVGADTGLPRRELAERLPVETRPRMGFCRLSVAAVITRQRQRSGRADGALFRHPRHQRPELWVTARFPTTSTTVEHQRSHPFRCSDGRGKAHVVVNRVGGMLLNHELAIPWRETKFELAANFSGALKGLFLHTELVQPRRSSSAVDAMTTLPPIPAFTAAQYDRLALLYAIASVRAGRWLVPAFHAALDADIRNGHDDPLNFDVESFAASLDRLVAACKTRTAAERGAIRRAGDPAVPRPFPEPFPLRPRSLLLSSRTYARRVHPRPRLKLCQQAARESGEHG